MCGFKRKRSCLLKTIVTTACTHNRFSFWQFWASVFRDILAHSFFSSHKVLYPLSNHHLSPKHHWLILSSSLFFPISMSPTSTNLSQTISQQLVLVCTMPWQGWRMFSILSSGNYDSFLVSAHALLFVKRQTSKPKFHSGVTCTKFYLPSIFSIPHHLFSSLLPISDLVFFSFSSRIVCVTEFTQDCQANSLYTLLNPSVCFSWISFHLSWNMFFRTVLFKIIGSIPWSMLRVFHAVCDSKRL